MKRQLIQLLAAATTAFVVLSGCSGSSSTKASAPSTVSRGVVTGFGSVYVNGVEYKTAGSKVHLPDDSATASTLGSSETEIRNHLKVGMVVTVKGSSDSSTGEASEIEFKDNLEGLVTAGTASSITVLGIAVNVDSSTKFYDNSGVETTSAAITPNSTWVEVSGVPDNNGNFIATYVGIKSADSKQELKGYVVAIAVDSFDLGLSAGIQAVTVNTALPAGIAVGDYVEVKFNTSGTVLEVEREDDQVKADSETSKAEVEGYVSAINGDSVTVSVYGNAQTVLLTGTTLYFAKANNGTVTSTDRSALVVGSKISAEGPLSNGVITATKIKIRTI